MNIKRLSLVVGAMYCSLTTPAIAQDGKPRTIAKVGPIEVKP